MAGKSRVVIVRLLSQAMTGFYYSFSRPRTSKPMSLLKYDPIGAYLLPTLLPFRYSFPAAGAI